MPVNTRSSIVSFALKTLTGAVASAVLISANAAGLGKLTVLSALGQPLRAEIELSAVTAEEASGLSARLAPLEAFRAANIDFNPALSALRFEVEQRNGRQLIRVSSSQPLNEPFVDLLMELNWNGGRMVREYTFLLDPPELRAAQSPQVAAPVDLGAARTPSSTTAPATAPVAAAPAAAPGTPPKPVATPTPARPVAKPTPAKPTVDEYTVKQGDNLTRIANQVKPTDVSLDVMLVALYRANPEAFAGNNMNRLKSGQILAVPDAGAIQSVASGADGAARAVVVAHARDFNAYRAKLAGQVANSTPSRDAEPGQNSSGKITAKVEEKPNAVNAARDKLTLSKATADQPAEGKTGAVVEDKIAKQKQVDDAASRVKELEKNVDDLTKLMEVKSNSAATAVKPAEPAVPAVPATPAASAPAPTKMAPVIPPRKIDEPGIVDKLVANWHIVALVLAALLAAVVGLIASRRRRTFVVPKDDRGVTETAPAPAWDPAPATVAAAAGAASQEPVAEHGNSVFNSNFAPSASQLDTNEVDPVAEADVYIAYGRDAQAEEILKEALRHHPERHPVRLKLLEIYAARNDARAFESQASELYSLSRGEGEEWAQAAQLGRALEPGNPLYALGGPDGADGFGAAPLAATAGVVAAATAAAAYAAYDADDADTAAQEPAAAAYNEDNRYNDDLETALPQAADAAVSPASIAAQANAADFGLGDLDFAAPAAATPAPSDLPPLDPASFLQDDSFNLAYDTPAPAPAPVPADDPTTDFSFDLPAEPVSAAPAAPTAPVADATSVPLDFDVADFTIPDVPALAAAPVPPAAPVPLPAEQGAPEFDLSGIDFDLGSQAETVEATDTARAEPMSALHMEMDTKLDLAVAYQEIGDKEGARELLDEVLRGGSDEQVAKANAMKEQLG